MPSDDELNKRTIASTTIEWNYDMDSIGLSIPALDDVTEFTLKTRCKRCWGSVRGRTDSEHRITGIKCLVCGKSLEGQPATDEEERISKESFANAVNADWGIHPKYGDGPFVQKVFPKIDRLSKEDLDSRVARSKTQYSKSPKGKLTRHEFPAHSPGWLFLEARILVDGLGGRVFSNDHSIIKFPSLGMRDDGSAAISLPLEEMSDDPEYEEHFTMSGIGENLISSLVAAFSCELAMKAISMTCGDQAQKEHDLIILFRDIPKVSQERVRADFEDIERVLMSGRRVFDTWRYFERAVGDKGLTAMIDVDRARALSKAARVILDEADMVGLWGKISVTGKQNVRITGQERDYRYKIGMTFKGGESPPRT